MDDKLAALIQRLETATARLELLSATNNSTPFISAASSNTAGVLSKMVQEYAVVLQSVYFKLSADIDPIALQQSKLVYSALEYIGQLLQASVTCKKPVGVAHIQPLQDLISQVVALKDANRSSKLYSHLCAVADGLPALGWVVVDLPVPYILEMKDSSQFYANRVIKENKETTHVQWVQAYLALLTDLAAFVKKFHTTGLVWNPKGTDFALPSANYQAKSQPAAPVAASAPAATSAPSGAPAANPFAQLGSVSLRKVEKSEMTHKNPELRANQPVKTAEKAVKAAFSSPPKCALEGNKWAIEYQQNATLTIEPEMHHVVYVYKCINTTIEIKGKVNAVTLGNATLLRCMQQARCCR